jgi:hypothetical protein
MWHKRIYFNAPKDTPNSHTFPQLATLGSITILDFVNFSTNHNLSLQLVVKIHVNLSVSAEFFKYIYIYIF